MLVKVFSIIVNSELVKKKEADAITIFESTERNGTN